MPNQLIQDLLKSDKSKTLKMGDDEEFTFKRIPFGIPLLDDLSGGGIPKKRFTIFTGASNAGKTLLATTVAKQVQKVEGSVAWVDTEQTWDANWQEACGLDVNDIIVSQPTSGEEAFDTIESLMDAGVDLIVLDSLAGIVPKVVLNEDFGYNPMAWQARFINQSLPKIFPHLRKGSAFIAINQIRQSLGPISYVNMPGGIGQNFWSHFIFELKRNGWLKEGDKNVGFNINVRLRKTKVGGKAFQDIDIPFKLEGGIDMLEILFRDAVEADTILQKGAWYDLGGKRYQGANNVREALLADPALLAKLELDTYKGKGAE